MGELFSIDLEICWKDGASFKGKVRAEAIMPAHQHGMNYKPEVASTDGDIYHLEGFAFHMQGGWQFVIELREDGETDTLLLDHDLK